MKYLIQTNNLNIILEKESNGWVSEGVTKLKTQIQLLGHLFFKKKKL